MDYSILNSENAQLLQAITDDEPSYTKETHSRNAEILKSIINDTEYTEPPQSEIEELLLELKEHIHEDVVVEPLSVSSNGTYTAPSGKAYTPVTVEVEPPEDSYQLKSITTPTSLATFEASAMPMPSLKVSVEAQQDLHGYDHPWVGGAGKNKAYVNEGNNLVIADVKANITYTFSCKHVQTQYNYGINLKKNNSTGEVLISDASNPTSLTFTPTEDCSVFINAYSYTSGVLVTDIIKKYQVEVGSTATSFAPYSNICPISGWDNAIVTDTDDVDNPTVTQTTTITLPQTVYGGEVDVVNGILKITDGYIASYNGETLPSTWISSMDVYAEGTTPTTGAEVCYELAEPIIINLTPSLIKSLNGTNNLSVDCGEVIEGEYFKALGGDDNA